MPNMNDVISQMKANDEFGLAAIRFLIQVNKLGEAAAFKAEMDSPTCSDPEWCRMIVNLAGGGDGIEFDPVNLHTYKCHLCRDKAFILTTKEGICYSRFCSCPEGQMVREGHSKADSKETKRKERGRGRSFTSFGGGDGLPG